MKDGEGEKYVQLLTPVCSSFNTPELAYEWNDSVPEEEEEEE